MDYTEKIDYSSLSTYMECPRKFLFQYIMHFRPGNKNLDLVFGSCWHYGLEQVYKSQMVTGNPSVIDATEVAIESFQKLWALEGKEQWPDHDAIFPKSPGRASDMYYDYFKRFLNSDLDERRPIAVEEPFTIDLSQFDTRLPNYIGRIDLIWEELNGNISIVDHKTAKAMYPISLTAYEVSFQTDGYITAGSLFYDKLPQMVYNIAICQKSKIDFHRYYITKRLAAVNQFLQDLRYYCSRIIRDLEQLEQDKLTATKRNHHISSFPRCPGSACTTFMRPCQYKEICMIRNNPLLWLDKAPQGFTVNEWDPDKHEEQMKEKLS